MRPAGRQHSFERKSMAVVCFRYNAIREGSDLTFDELLSPDRLYAAALHIPAGSGLYGAWFTDALRDVVPYDGCHTAHGRTLLYIGKAKDLSVRPCNQHVAGKCRGSTLRRAVVAVAAELIGVVPVSIVDAGGVRRLTLLGDGEARLTSWMQRHVAFSCILHKEPEAIEREAILAGRVPLNSDGNHHHQFHPRLNVLRTACGR
jgi:hypothetical protein